MTITIAMTGMFFLTNIVLPLNAQNTSTNSIEVYSVRSLLDQAVEEFNNGDTTVALQQLYKAENSLDRAEDKLEAMLVSNQSVRNKKNYFTFINFF